MKKSLIRLLGLTGDIFKALLVLGDIIFAPQNPYRALRMLGLEGVADRDREWKRLYRPLYELKQRKLIRMRQTNKGWHVEITAKGKSLAEYVEIQQLQLPRPRTWDKKWRMVVFDIPISKNDRRLAFSQKLKHLGFRMVQKSVWMYPHECYAEIQKLLKWYHIEQHVSYAVLTDIHGMSTLQEKFTYPLR